MEIKKIAIITDWGLQNPTHLLLERSIRDVFGSSIDIFFIQKEIFPLFALQSIYYVRKTLRLLGPNILMLNLCDIYRLRESSLSLIETDDNLILTMGHADYLLYDETLHSVRNTPMRPIHDLRDFISELTFFLSNIQDVEYNSKAPSNAFLPRITRNGMEIQILHIDAHKNLVTNLTHEKYVKEIAGKVWKIMFYDSVIPYDKEAWTQAKGNELFGYFNSAGLLKLVKKNGLLADLFGFRMAPEQSMFNMNLQIEIAHDH